MSAFKPFAIVVKNHYEPTYSLRLVIESADITIGKLKSMIEQEHKGNPQLQDQLLVHRGKLLESKTNLHQLFTSSIIDDKSPTNDNKKTDSMQCMYIHMTLRGGSETALKIGLMSKPEPQSEQTQPEMPPQPQPQPQPAEEEKYDTANTNAKDSEPPHTASTDTATSSASPSMPRTIPRQLSDPLPAYPTYPHPPPPPYAYHPHHPYPPAYPPPAPYAYHPDGAPHYFSHSMPDLMAGAHLYRQRSAPSPSTSSSSANRSRAFAPPTLVQQTSNSNLHRSAAPPPPSPYHHPYYAYPTPPAYPGYPPHGYAPPPPHHHHPAAPHYPYFSHSTSDLLRARDPRKKNKSKRDGKRKVERIDEKENGEENQNNVGRVDNLANIAADGLRRRGGRNNDGDNNNNNRQPAVEANNVNNNVFANDNNANDRNRAQRESFFARLFRVLNVNILIRLGIFMWLFAPNLGTYRFTMLCIAGGLYYLHQVGILGGLFGRFGANRNQNEPQHRDPNAPDSGDRERAPPPRLSYVQLLQRFLIGIVASLWPTWDHRNLYPIPRP
eukprot:CAMPEP_0197029076 /NCGR_PEP_ID=MMETSP1384-20130603/8604_1 /TAXON_ID=29189 /ORGANISM="Ammonia sp." /LENGTH=551 /DNA_ID=CAMNT_0042458179 /DNA_START=22 /DNA_END=1680 /DNA_ORIENTATION=+